MRDNEKVEKALIQRANAVRTGAELLAEVTRDVQLLEQYISNRMRPEDFQLTVKQQAKLKRYNFIYEQLISGKPTSVIVAMLTNKNLYSISQAQAYEDIRCSKELFGSVAHINKRFDLNNEIEINKIYRNKAIEMHDYKNAAVFSKVIKDLYAQLPDEEESAGENFETHKLEVTFNPRSLGGPDMEMPDMKEVLRILNEKRNVKIKIDMFPELEYTETDNGNNTEAL